MTIGIISETTSLWQEQPEKARSAPAVTARTEGSQATLTAGPFSWQVDLPQPLGGINQAPSPTALLLGALAGCAGPGEPATGGSGPLTRRRRGAAAPLSSMARALPGLPGAHQAEVGCADPAVWGRAPLTRRGCRRGT